MLTVRLEKEEAYHSGEKSKKQVWKDIHKEILKQDPNFSYPYETLVKKFTNLMTTYKRIKKRNTKSGRGGTLWPYFGDFDQVYGNKHFIQAPEQNLCDTLDLEVDNETSNGINTTNENVAPNVRNKKRSYNDIMSYLEQMETEDKTRHEEYISIEKQKIHIDKEKVEVEREKVKVLVDLKLLLQQTDN